MSAALDPSMSAAVIAAAGTGKTWTLTARIVRLLLAGAAPGGILALTFTRKAAGEMRERIAEVLQTLAFADAAKVRKVLSEMDAPSDDSSVARARELFEQFIHAESPLKAMTLHSFCADLLARFPLEAEVPAGFSLAEDERELRQAALDALLRDLHRKPDSAENLAFEALLAHGLSDNQLLDLLRGFFDVRAAFWAAGENALATLDKNLVAALSPVANADGKNYQIDHPALSAKLKLLYGLLRDCGDLRYVKAAALEPALDACGDARLDALIDALLSGTGTPYALTFLALNPYSPQQKNTLSELFLAVSEATVHARDARRKYQTLARSRAGLALGSALLAHFAAAQQRTRQLCFPELEWRTAQLLSATEGRQWVLYKLDARLQHLLLDEFQDTNPTQWRLLLPLLQEFAEDASRPRSAFLVGDPKQSIYGFRGAHAKLLHEASDWLVSHLGAAQLKLNVSRRSAAVILDFANALFSNDYGAAMGYETHSAHESLSQVCGAIEVAPLITAEVKTGSSKGLPETLRNPLTTPLKADEESLAEHEGSWVAERIRQLVEQRTPVSEQGQVRALHYGDVMVLARNRTHLWAIESALAAAGVAFASATRATLLATPLARDLLALLRWLDAPHRNLELAHALRAPVFAVSDAELLQLARAARVQGCSWFLALATLLDSEPLQRAHRLLNGWLALARSLPPHDLIDRIIAEGDLLRRTQAVYPGDSRIAGNLGALLQLALDTDQGRYPSLSGFINHCETLQTEDGPNEAAPAGGEQRVRVLTVHGAKGLEAAAVFLVNSAPKPAAAKGGWKADWPAGAEAPTCLVHVGNKAAQDPFSERLLAEQKQREADEDVHLLYVAVTRARQYLYVSGFAVSGAGSSISWHQRCRDALAKLMPQVPGASDLVRYQGSVPAPIVTTATMPPGAITPLAAGLLLPLRSTATAAPLPETNNAAAARHGEWLHALLEALAPPQPQLCNPALRARLTGRLGAITDADFAAAEREAQAVLNAPALAAIFAPEHRAWNEVALHIASAEDSQINVLDRLIDTGAALWIIDYKTHRSGDAAAVLAGAREQLLRYLAAVQRLYPGRALRAAVVWTPTAQLLELLP